MRHYTFLLLGPGFRRHAAVPRYPIGLAVHEPPAEGRLDGPPGPAVRLVGHDVEARGTSWRRNSGHEWREYDIRPYTDRMRQDPQPQQAILDWILRETGTESWFCAAACRHVGQP